MGRAHGALAVCNSDYTVLRCACQGCSVAGEGLQPISAGVCPKVSQPRMRASSPGKERAKGSLGCRDGNGNDLSLSVVISLVLRHRPLEAEHLGS